MSNLIPNLPGLPVIDYTSRDYSGILNDLINLIPTFLPEWTDRSPGNFGIALLELFSYVGDILNYYIDRISNEAFLSTAQQYQSILNIASLLDYTPSGSIAATATLQFTIANPSPNPVTIGQGTVVTTNPQQGVIQSFQTTASLTIWGDNTNPSSATFQSLGTALQQVLLTGPFDGSTVTVVYQNTVASQINGGTSVINNGTNITSVQFKSLPVAVASGDSITLSNGVSTMTLNSTSTVSASTSPVSINVTSTPANDSYTPGSATLVGSTTAWNNYKTAWVKAPSNSFVGVSSSATDYVVLNGNTVEFGNNVNGVIPGNGANFLITYWPFNGSQYSATVTAINSVQVTGETIGISNGNADQTYFLFQSPVVNASVSVQVTIGGVSQTWIYFSRLVDAGPTDLAYTTTTDQNGIVQVVFGDSTNGVIPAPGAAITANYQVGGGSAGNVAANTIINFGGLPGVISVTNTAAATGGSDVESVQHIRTHAPLALTALNRAVTLADYAALAQNNINIAKAAAVQGSAPTLVNLYIHPHGGFSSSTSQLASNVNLIGLQLTNAAGNGYLDTRKPAYSTVTVSPPKYNNGTTTVTGYVPVNISVTVQVYPNYSQSSVLVAVQSALANLLSFDTIDFGYRVTVSSVYQALQGIPGVMYAQLTNLARLESAQPVVADVVCAAFEIPQLNLPNQPVIIVNGGINF